MPKKVVYVNKTDKYIMRSIKFNFEDFLGKFRTVDWKKYCHTTAFFRCGCTKVDRDTTFCVFIHITGYQVLDNYNFNMKIYI